MFLIVLFWLLLLLWAVNGFWAFLPHPVAHLCLLVLLIVLGLRVLGNPLV
jgi:hypothetical protein